MKLKNDGYWFAFFTRCFKNSEKELLAKYPIFSQELREHNGYLTLTTIALDNFLINRDEAYDVGQMCYRLHIIQKHNNLLIATIYRNFVAVNQVSQYDNSYSAEIMGNIDELNKHIESWWSYFYLRYKKNEES